MAKQISPVPSPAIAAGDAIGYIAVNPVQDGEIALVVNQERFDV
jgi:hypothetical protein